MYWIKNSLLGLCLLCGSVHFAVASSVNPVFSYLIKQAEQEVDAEQIFLRTLQYIEVEQSPRYFSHLFFLLDESMEYLNDQVEKQSQFSSDEFAQSLQWNIESFTNMGSWNFMKGSEKRSETFEEYMILGQDILEVSVEQYNEWEVNSKLLRSEISALKKEYSALQKQIPSLVSQNADAQQIADLKQKIRETVISLSEKETERIEIIQHQKKMKPQIEMLQQDLEQAEKYKDALIKEVYLEEIFGG